MKRVLSLTAVAIVGILFLVAARPVGPAAVGRVMLLGMADGGTFPDAGANVGGIMYDPYQGLVYSNGIGWVPPGISQAQADSRYTMITPAASYPNARQRSILQTKVLGTTNNIFLQYGLTWSQTVSGTATLDNTKTYPAILYETTTSALTTGGLNTTDGAGAVKWPARPIYSVNMRTTSVSTTGNEMYFGLTEGTLFSNPEPQPGPVASSSFQGVFIGYSIAQQATWMCCAADGSNQSCTSTGITVAINTDYTMVVDFSNASAITCTVNGTSVTHSTNIPSSTTASPQVVNRIQNQTGGALRSFIFYDWSVSVK